MTRGAIATLAVLAGVALSASSADAATFQGETTRSQWVTVEVGPDGLLRRAEVNWIVRCRRLGLWYRGSTTFVPELDVLTPERFADSGRYRERTGPYRARITAKIWAFHHLDPLNAPLESWSGTLRLHVVLRRGGRVGDRCRLGTVRWETFLLEG